MFDAQLTDHNDDEGINGWYKDFLILKDDYYLHPDAKNWISDAPYSSIGKPYSAGCIIPRIGDFNNFTQQMNNLGFKYGDIKDGSRDSIRVEIKLSTQLQQPSYYTRNSFNNNNLRHIKGWK
ncbi:hypothetical protein [Spirochaeta cellobiosiphila]|uniref:hypothetical protein n=1 Tax=Spirochaeta cellobiosiphila TaxID=504483 RepID=UPI00041FD069|nr:hypothetical protein [Spirochaeta cellobiosiphila]